MEQNKKDDRNLAELAKLFLKLGLIAFGGPAAHIAMMEDEVVTKRKWMTHQHFLDLIGATNLIPGPNSTEMAIHTGYQKAGALGLIIAGSCFIFPAVILTGFLAYFYKLYGNLPEIKPFLYGIKPAVIIIILNAVYKLSTKAVWVSPAKGTSESDYGKRWKLISIAVIVAIINFSGVNEIFSILAGGIFGALFIFLTMKKNLLNILLPLPIISFFTAVNIFQGTEKNEINLTKLFLVFLKIGSILFGSGYVLIAYLNGELVQGLYWLTRQQLLDAIAIGQFTPGPVLSTATFIGFQLAGISGAILATIGIFLPSFIFVLIVNPVVPKLRNSKIFSVFLDAVNASALAIMFVVAVKLGAEVLVNWQSIFIAVLSAATFFYFKKINSAYVVLGGAIAGYLLNLF